MIGRLLIALCAAMLMIGGYAVPVVNAQDKLPPAPYAYRQLDNPADEAEAQELMETLRCLKCQSQSIADSDAPMAGDMRHEVRTRIAAGESPEQVRLWLIDRYGDYVSYKPQVNSATWPLFVLPVLFIVIVVMVMFGRMRRKTPKSGSEADNSDCADGQTP